MLLSAGHESTANTLGLAVLALLRHPEQLRRLRDTDDPDLLRGAVELLRYLTVVENPVIRVATPRDITIGGQLVRAGEGLIVSLQAGNRDPALTSDPDTLDIDRGTRDHLAFGHGVHLCPGQHLARLEIRLALSTLLNRLPTLRLAVPFKQVSFHTGMAIFGLRALPVTW